MDCFDAWLSDPSVPSGVGFLQPLNRRCASKATPHTAWARPARASDPGQATPSTFESAGNVFCVF